MKGYWDGYWKSKSIVSRIVDFMREHYFCKIPIYHMGNIKNKLILEPGCGTSETLVRIARQSKKVVGFDISKESLEVSRLNFKKHKVPKNKYELVLGDMHKMKFKDNSFDIVFNAGVMEHFDDDKINNVPLKEMVRVTKKGGQVVFLVPCVYSPYYLWYLVSRIPGLHRIFPGEENHRFYTFKIMKEQFEGLKQEYNLNVKCKMRLCWRTMFLYMVGIIEK